MANIRVRDNSSSRIAASNLGKTQGKLLKTLEKLASGYRINRSADDASGLSISEKMRSLITGLGQAEQNSLDGLSLVETGEGALAEIHAMLNRVVELSTISANGTYTDEIDREALQKELDHLRSEVDRIAKNANFNSIKLFQDKGMEYEGVSNGTAKTAGLESSTEIRTVDDVLANTKEGEINLIYTEDYKAVTTTQNPEGTNTLGSDITIEGKKLSDILKTEIIPNTVQNILKSYPAFSYLNGSSIGIGLEYFSEGASGGTTTLAYVKASVGSSGSVSPDGTLASREDYITYTLGVNTTVLSGITTREGLQELEATIAHEMIHAFMDEATTSGMFGKTAVSTGELTTTVDKFPDWFIEGMAQTASGPGNWLKSMGISGTSNDESIKTAIQRDSLGSGSTASQYGTGYLACMYLGAVIAGGGNPPTTVDAASISEGLTKLFNEVIGGKSLDEAISALTNGKFSSCANFVSKFNNGSAEIGSFVRNLLYETGSGRGGIVSGDLAASDLTADTDLGATINLFLLNTDNSKVQNIYPEDYPVYSGGSTKTDGTVPTDFTPVDPVLPSAEYGDLIVSGTDLANNIDYDANTGVLTVKGAGDIKISMKAGASSSTTNKIVLTGMGKVTLDGLQLSASDALTIKSDAEIKYEGENSFGNITLESDVKATFSGNGQIKADIFSSNNTNTVHFSGGAIIVGNQSGGNLGSGNITAGQIIIDHASVAANLQPDPKDSSGKTLQFAEMPLDSLGNLKDIVSISFNDENSRMLLDIRDEIKLWLDPSLPLNKITVTDSSGATKTLAAKYENGQFKWLDIVKPFTVSGGTEGTDWEYGDDGHTLIIKTDTPLTISGGTGAGPDGEEFVGRIQLNDGISGNVQLTLDRVNCSVTSGCAFDLGNNNHVILTIADNTSSTFTSGNDYAGISLGTDTHLTIEGSDTGNLIAAGGSDSAGIGSSSADKLTAPGSSITIKGGNIKATGGQYGAGIGAGHSSAFGDIEIIGGTITADGGTGGAGIGGAYLSKVGDIQIDGGTITAKSAAHGAGIGGGWGGSATNGTITITGGIISASSTQHGTGIGAGCSGTSGKISISGGTIEAEGGSEGAGIGASWTGKCGEIEITGGDINAKGGSGGAGIGAGGSGSRVGGTITIDTPGTVIAQGGNNGVGIGSGYGNSSCGDIVIKQGTVKAVGNTDSTGIGSGRGSTSGDVTIGDVDDPDKKIVLDAIGGMTNNGGNIISYTDTGHTNEGTLTITGNNTTVRPGNAGEGLYSTSGAVDENGDQIYSYPVYLFAADPPLESGEGLENAGTTGNGLPLPDGIDKSKIQISATSASGVTKTWEQGLIHEPEDNYAFIWMGGENQTLTISYDDQNGTSQTVTLDLIFHPDAGVFRISSQPDPPPAEKPEYVTGTTPSDPTPPVPIPPGSDLEEFADGIILHIGAGSNETLRIPRFYLSANALKMDAMDISAQEKARETMDIVGEAIDRVSSIRASYGALANRLEHNQQQLSQTRENISAAESRIRDVDMAKEYMDYVSLTIKRQAAQSALAHSNQDARQILQLLQ